jgi:hypothetical protein
VAKTMRLKSISFGLLLILASHTVPLGAAQRCKYGCFDRLAVVQKFVDEIYPGLIRVHGLILSRSEGFHLSSKESLSSVEVDIMPCRPGSGIPGEGAEPQRPAIPHCTGLFLPSLSEFLTMSVGFSDKFPISGFQARGSFVEAKGQAAKQEIWDHPEWGRPEWTEAVLRAKPQFGPAQKQELLQSIPEQTIKALREFTGCELDLETASFWVNRLGNKPDPMRVEIQWMVSGHKTTEGAGPNSCGAMFEPFEGKLLSVGAPVAAP